VSWVGATAKLVDVDPDTHLLTADAVAAAIGPKTRCVIPVHLMGSTVDLDPIVALARDAGLRVIEDTAQAHGADHRGRRVGSIGDIGCFSFYPTKNLGGWGDGGAIATSDEELATRIRLLRSHGESPRYHHRMVGTTARLDALQAALLRVKLRSLDDRNADRRRLGAALRAGLEGTSVELPAPAFEGADHVYHLFIVRSKRRDALRAHLEAHGISTAVHYPFPIHRTEAYGSQPEGSLPVAERLAEEICTLPLFPTMSDAEVERIVSACESFDGEE
jgi:dTDP-4-amino-4,6-dideoxygalactose transaminase